jgi:rubrerythrin
MYVKKNTRVTFRSNKRYGHKRSNSFSNDRGRNKGNITQQYQKYLKLAKEASSSGDRIQSEYYYQFADHYSRLMLELGLFIEENLENQNPEELKSIDQKSDNENNLDEVVETDKDNEATDTEDKNDHSSIESVPFISQPAKKKSVRTKKDSA